MIRSALGLALLTFGLLVLAPVELRADLAGELSGLELTPQVRWQMRQLNEAWQKWTQSFEKGSGQEAAYLEQILEKTRQLGMKRLPDLATAAAAYAVKSARAGDFDSAERALAAARRLDDSRPDIPFASAELARARGAYGEFVKSTIAGYGLKLRSPLERTLMAQNASLALLYILLIAGALFVGVLMIIEGGALFYDLARLLSPPLERKTADIVTILLLAWPIILPSGWLWLLLLWSVLLWAYAAKSERVVLVLVWILLGISPIILGQQQRAVQVALAPPTRLLENLANDRLYGALFTDAEALVTMVPDHPAVTEILADIHRRMGQWDYARAIYTNLTQDPEQNDLARAASYNNLGVYYHRRKEYETAISYFRRATEVDQRTTEAFFNMGQSYSQLYDFNNSHSAMGRAKAVDNARVEELNQQIKGAADAAEAVVAIDGGLRRQADLKKRLAGLWRPSLAEQPSLIDLWRRNLALTVSLFAFLLAVTLGHARSQLGFRSTPLDTTPFFIDNRWARLLIPGLDACNDDRGLAAFVALLLPVTCVVLMVLSVLGYRSPNAFDPGALFLPALGLLGLVLILAWRFKRSGQAA